MLYFVAALSIIIISRGISGSWRKTFVLPWVILTMPLLVGAGLANLDLVPFLISSWSTKTHVVVILGTAVLGLSSFTMQHVRGPLHASSKEIMWNERTLVSLLLIVTCVALIANALQFIIGGEIPLFSPDPDHARVEVGKNGYLHVFSVLPGHIIPIAAFVLFTGKNIKKSTRRILIGIIAVSFILLSLWIARGLLLYPILAVIALNYLLDRNFFNFKKILMIAAIVIFVVSGIKYFRGVIRYGDSFVQTQKQLSSFERENALIGPAVSLYLTFALNYEILNRYVEAVPAIAPHTNGRLVANHLLTFIPGTGRPFSELDYQNLVLKKKEYEYTLTSTFLGIPYLEFGLPGVVFFSILVGQLYKIIWIRMLQKGNPLSVFFYGYLISMIAFIPFTFIYSQVSFIWFIVSSLPLLYLSMCRIKGVSAYYRKNRVVFARNPHISKTSSIVEKS